MEYPSVSLPESRAAGSTSVWRHSVGATVEHHLEKQHSKDALISEHGWETFKKLKKEIFKRSKNTENGKTKWWSRHFFFHFQTFGNWSGPAREKAKYEIDEENQVKIMNCENYEILFLPDLQVAKLRTITCAWLYVLPLLNKCLSLMQIFDLFRCILIFLR